MRGEIISIGTELLLGDIVNTNAAYIARKLAQYGIDVFYITVVGDNYDRLINVLQKTRERSHLIITTGGLGPTSDDITRNAIASAFDRKLVTDIDTVKMIKDYFATRNLPLPPGNLSQAMYPEGGEMLFNPLGTAPGLFVKDEQNLLFALPGVPREMEIMLTERVLPRLKEYADRYTIHSLLIRITGMGESQVENNLIDLIRIQTNPTIALLASDGEVFVRLTCKETSKEFAQTLINDVREKIKEKLGSYIYGYDDESLASVVMKQLNQRGLTLALAESCTGGLLGDTITNVPGASKILKGGIVAYSNSIKSSLLNVPINFLDQHGAVSQEVALAMARGAQKNLKADIGLAVSGIAGPAGDSKEKPVGTTCFAYSGPDGEKAATKYLGRDRQQNKVRAVKHALNLLRLQLLNLI